MTKPLPRFLQVCFELFQGKRHWILLLFALYILATWWLRAFTISLTSIKPLHPFPANGTFQLHNPLRRIEAGQMPGRDFQVFHGVLLPYLFYPAYTLGGSNVFAAEFSRYITSQTMIFCAVGFFFWSWTRSSKKTILYMAAFLAVYRAIGSEQIMIPQNSLVNIRSLWSLVVAGSLLLSTRRGFGQLGYQLTSGFFLAILVLTSMEQGTYFLVALAALFIVAGITIAANYSSHFLSNRKDLITLCWSLVITLLTGFLWAIFILGALTNFDANIIKTILEYSYQVVPNDQFWYFGVPPNIFIGATVEQADWYLRFFLQRFLFLGFLAAGSVSLFYHRFLSLPKLSISLLLIFYTVMTQFTQLGFRVSSHDYPLIRLTIIFAVILFGAIINQYGETMAAWVKRQSLPFVRILMRRHEAKIGLELFIYTMAIYVIGLLFLHVLVTTARFRLAAISSVHLSTYWQEWQTNMQQAIEPQASLWSTYSNFFEADQHFFHPATDYMIHALGPYRDHYNQLFIEQQPTYVQTFVEYFDDTGTLWVYEEWLQTTNWPFWEELLKWYEPKAQVGHSIIWQRQSTSKAILSASDVATPVKLRTLGQDRYVFTVSKGVTGIVLVDLEYSIEGLVKKIPIVRNLTRYFVVTNGNFNDVPVSIPPYKNTVTVPIYIDLSADTVEDQINLDQDIILSTQVASPLFFLPLDTLKIKQVDYRWLPLTKREFSALARPLNSHPEFVK